MPDTLVQATPSGEVAHPIPASVYGPSGSVPSADQVPPQVPSSSLTTLIPWTATLSKPRLLVDTARSAPPGRGPGTGVQASPRGEEAGQTRVGAALLPG